MLVDWNQTEAEFPQQTCLHDMFETAGAAHARRDSAPSTRSQELSYRELNQRAQPVGALVAPSRHRAWTI